MTMTTRYSILASVLILLAGLGLWASERADAAGSVSCNAAHYHDKPLRYYAGDDGNAAESLSVLVTDRLCRVKGKGLTVDPGAAVTRAPEWPHHEAYVHAITVTVAFRTDDGRYYAKKVRITPDNPNAVLSFRFVPRLPVSLNPTVVVSYRLHKPGPDHRVIRTVRA